MQTFWQIVATNALLVVVLAAGVALLGRVESAFMHGGRDITARKSLEWGDVEKAPNGNVSIRYKYRTKIWDKETKIMNQVFTFDPKGEFVSVKDVE